MVLAGSIKIANVLLNSLIKLSGFVYTNTYSIQYVTSICSIIIVYSKTKCISAVI